VLFIKPQANIGIEMTQGLWGDVEAKLMPGTARWGLKDMAKHTNGCKAPKILRWDYFQDSDHDSDFAAIK
jgi:hypothetical protein